MGMEGTTRQYKRSGPLVHEVNENAWKRERTPNHYFNSGGMVAWWVGRCVGLLVGRRLVEGSQVGLWIGKRMDRLGG